MDLSKLSLIFKILIIAIIYIIIFTALKIMYKDMKGSSRGRKENMRSFGLEILEPGSSSNLRKGGVIPIKDVVTIGRKSDNVLVLNDPYASSYHAKVYLKNGECVLEDLDSTNGTMLNGERLIGKEYLSSGDEIKIGEVSFKFI
ncbi:MAG: FHA domain-containing protein [Solirubrobacterales bacterium]